MKKNIFITDHLAVHQKWTQVVNQPYIILKKSVLSNIKIATPAFFNFFWISENIYGWALQFIQNYTICLLIGEVFRPFILNVIIIMLRFKIYPFAK